MDILVYTLVVIGLIALIVLVHTYDPEAEEFEERYKYNLKHIKLSGKERVKESY